MKVSYLECCPATNIEAVRVLLDTNRERQHLCWCTQCGQYWFHRFFEIMKFDGPDDQTVWYSPVNPEEARRILQTEGRPDLTFLLTRPSFEDDNGSVRRVSGQPDKPYYV